MGNKTRQHHNTQTKLRKLLETPAPASSDALEFPFHPVDQMTMVFGASIPGYREVIAACPAEFQDYHNPWCRLAESIFFSCASMSTWKWRSPAIKSDQLRYLKTWLGSFEPKHETKEAVCAWLLSLILTELPPLK